jgi:hypothetical protein
MLLALAAVLAAVAGPILTDVPAQPDPKARYVFYLHGRILEEQGRNAVSPDFGKYEYDAILQALAAPGYTVVGEIRGKGAGDEFADKVAGQIRALRAAGVPSPQIAVIGASKGAGLTLAVSAAVGDPEIAYVVLAGCAASDERAAALRGRILSIYDVKDRFQPSCQDTFRRAKALTARHEIVLTLGLDHGLLYKPYREWLDPAFAWIRRASPR